MSIRNKTDIFCCGNEALFLIQSLITRIDYSISKHLLRLDKVCIKLCHYNFLLPALNRDNLEAYLLNAYHILFACDYCQLKSFIKPNLKVLDIGAGLGFYAIPYSTISHVYAFEPLPLHYSFLVMNSHLNNTLTRVYPYAVCPFHGTARFYIAERLLNSSLDRQYVDDIGFGVTSHIDVKCLSFKSILKSLGPFDIVKIDVEGLEYELLKSACDVLPRYVTKLVIEVHNILQGPEEVAALLEKLGYTVVIYRSTEMPYQDIVYACK